MRACGAILSYAVDHVKRNIPHLRWIRSKCLDDSLIIDSSTQRHLELTKNQIDGGKYGTLFGVLDHTRTVIGGRLLKKTIHSPLRSIARIRERLEKVDFLNKKRELLSSLREQLSRVLDIERIVSKLAVGKGNARDLISLRNSLIAVGAIKKMIAGMEILKDEEISLGDFNDLTELIAEAIVDDPPVSVKEGGMIRDGYNRELDGYRDSLKNSREWLNRYQMEEARKHGISSLKLRYNRIIGYFIEVTKANLHLVPSMIKIKM